MTPRDADATALIVRTGLANTASVKAGLLRAGCAAVETEDPADVADAARVVLPGVGSFGHGIARLEELGVARALRERVAAGRPTLCVCLGMQLLFGASEEAPGAVGLAAAPGRAARFPATDAAGEPLRVPQLGWNTVRVEGEPDGWAYFANSFRVGAEHAPALEEAGWRVGVTDYGGPFVGLLRRGGVLACQFHPELSSVFGRRLLGEWVRSASAPAGDGAIGATP